MNYLSNGQPIRSLLLKKKKLGGRNVNGRITCWHRGGGASQFVRLVNHSRSQFNVPAVVRRLEVAPLRNAFLALVCYRNGSLSYIIAAHGVKVGDVLVNWQGSFHLEEYSRLSSFFLQNGNNLPILSCPIGSLLFNLTFDFDHGSSAVNNALCVRSAGASAKLLKRFKEFSLLRLPSGEVRMFSSVGFATIGFVSNKFDSINFSTKAGNTRWLGLRPTVRGVAMNPIDHPHGGNTSGGRCSSSPWGRLTKGKPTRSVRLANKLIVSSSRQQKVL